MRRALTVRQTQVIRLIAEGLINKEIADRLDISKDTVDRHIEAIFKRLAVHTKAHAVCVWIKAGFRARAKRTLTDVLDCNRK